jgi:hypothetical protein
LDRRELDFLPDLLAVTERNGAGFSLDPQAAFLARPVRDGGTGGAESQG